MRNMGGSAVKLAQETVEFPYASAHWQRQYTVTFEYGEPVYVGVINCYDKVMTVWHKYGKRNQGAIIKAVIEQAKTLRREP